MIGRAMDETDGWLIKHTQDDMLIVAENTHNPLSGMLDFA
jgi:hypothetical protein